MAITVEDLYRQYAGREADPGGLAFWQQGFGSDISPEEVASFQRSVAEARAQGSEPQATVAPETNAPSLVDQILGSSNTSAWTGEGFGSAKANAEDMAKVLSRAGITDVGQLGVRNVEVPAVMGYTDSGQEFAIQGPSVAQEYYNKATGQAVEPSYDRAGGNIFSGTFKGKDSTSYGVQFDASGRPQFYTQQGASTSDIGSIAPFLALGSLALGLPGIFGGALNSGLGLGLGTAGTAALGGAATGGLMAGITGGNVLQGALLGGVGGYASGSGLFGGEAGSTSGYYNEITGEFIPDALGGLQGPLTNLSGTNIGSMDGYSYDPATQTWTDPTGAQTTSITGVTNGAVTGQDLLDSAGAGAGVANTPGYYNEITGEFIEDPLGGLQGPLDNTSGTNIGSMDGYSYNPATQTWTTPDGVKTTAVTGVTNGAVTGQDLLNSAGAGATTGALAGLTPSQIANLVKAGVGLLGAGGAVSVVGNGGGSNTVLQAPTQKQPEYTPGYYNQLQQYYNSYLPQTPRDVVTPLQQWYNSSYGA